MDDPEIGEDNFTLADEKLMVVSKCIKYADEYFDEGDSRYGETCWWDDGDFRVKIRHGFGKMPDTQVHHYEEINFKASDGCIYYIEAHENMVSREIEIQDHVSIEEIELEGDYE